MSIVEMLSYDFMQNALIASMLIALILPFIGIIIYIRKMGFIADAIGHINLSGIAFAIFAGSLISQFESYTFFIALIWTILGAILMEFLREKFKNYKEVSIVIVYALAVSLTIIFLSLSTGYNSGLFNILFGNINAVSDQEVVTIFVLTVAILILMKFFFSKFILISMEDSFVKMYGINYQFLRYFLMVIITIVIALTIKLIGVLLVSSMLVIPLLSAIKLSKTLRKTVIVNIIITEFCFISGIVVGYFTNIPGSALIVLIAFLIYIITLFLKRNES